MFKTKREMERLLKRHGCRIVRQGNNHEIWESPITNARFPLSRGGVSSRRTYLSLLKQAGIED
jgi:N-acyl-L-homoserine lactone synthetase